MVAGRAQGGGQLGGEQVEFRREVEFAVVVQGDGFKERTDPCGLTGALHVDAQLPVMGGESVDEGGLAGGLGAFDG